MLSALWAPVTSMWPSIVPRLSPGIQGQRQASSSARERGEAKAERRREGTGRPLWPCSGWTQGNRLGSPKDAVLGASPEGLPRGLGGPVMGGPARPPWEKGQREELNSFPPAALWLGPEGTHTHSAPRRGGLRGTVPGTRPPHPPSADYQARCAVRGVWGQRRLFGATLWPRLVSQPFQQPRTPKGAESLPPELPRVWSRPTREPILRKGVWLRLVIATIPPLRH